jgi:hypothetical protein
MDECSEAESSPPALGLWGVAKPGPPPLLSTSEPLRGGGMLIERVGAVRLRRKDLSIGPESPAGLDKESPRRSCGDDAGSSRAGVEETARKLGVLSAFPIPILESCVVGVDKMSKRGLVRISFFDLEEWRCR